MDTQRKTVHVSCNLCGADHPELLFTKNGFGHVKCSECGLIYVTPRLSDHVEQQEVFWEKEMSLDDVEAMGARDYKKSRRKRLLSEAVAYVKYRKTGHVLDIGCGFGAFLKVAKELGWEHPEGIEIAPQAISYTSRFFPVRRDVTEEEPHRKGLFDVIRLNNVIEHLPDPKNLVRSVHELLRPGGLFVVATPNYDSISVSLCGSRWQYIGGEDHIYLFTPQTLRRLLEMEGFRIVDIKTKGIHLSPNNRTVGHKTMFSVLCRRTSMYIERLLDLLVRHTQRGHRLKMLAEKT